MLTGTNLVFAKQYNLRIVHEVIRLYGPLSRADIARHTELTGQTVSNLVKELMSLGLVYEAERRQEGRGAPSTALAINPDAAYSVGLDLDRDHLTAVLVDLAGRVRQRMFVGLDFPTPEQALDIMVRTVESLVQKQGLTLDEIWGVGVGISGPMYKGADGRDYVANPKAVPGWQNVPLATWLRERTGLPVFFENNATAAAVGERWYGAGRHIKSFFYMYFGSGLGGGLVLDGKPVPGFTGNAAEIAYLPPMAEEPPITDLRGEKSHVGLHFYLPRVYERLRAEGLEARTPEDLEGILARGHPSFLDWMDTGADYITGLLLAIELLVDPEAIVFGGRLPDGVLQGLMERVAVRLPQRRVIEKLSSPRHLLASAGVDAAALGVATLPIYELFAPAPRVLFKQRKGTRAAGLHLERPAAVG